MGSNLLSFSFSKRIFALTATLLELFFFLIEKFWLCSELLDLLFFNSQCCTYWTCSFLTANFAWVRVTYWTCHFLTDTFACVVSDRVYLLFFQIDNFACVATYWTFSFSADNCAWLESWNWTCFILTDNFDWVATYKDLLYSVLAAEEWLTCTQVFNSSPCLRKLDVRHITYDQRNNLLI